VRVSPNGETVVAGRAPGAARIELLDNDKVIAGEKVDQNGQFVLLPPPLAGGDHLLALRIFPDGKAPITSTQSVAVAVRPSTSPLVTLAEPGKPSVVLAAPEPTRPAAPAQKPAEIAAAAANTQVLIQTAEVEAGGRFFATGTAPPGATVRLYLNGTHVADAAVASDGKWSLTIGKGVSGGKYALRADAVDDQGKVISRAEVPFDAPVAVAAAPPQAQPPQARDAAAATGSPPGPPTTPSSGATGEPTSSFKEPEKPSRPALGAPPSSSTAMAPPSPPQPAQAPQAATPAPGIGATVATPSPTANPVVKQISTATVTRGDSLWKISRKLLGSGARYTVIYEANAKQIRNPNLIYSGQVFVIPPK
jgi:nucleoid-associated protein YgaU